MLCCPVIGPCFFLVGNVLYLTVFSGAVDLEDVIFSKERVKTYLHADEERERNVVPLEEAIEITDKENLRSLMLNIVRTDVNQSLAKVSMALDGEDTETAHYAASVLQDTLNEFRNKVQKKLADMEKGDQYQVDYAADLIEYMDDYLRQHVLTDLEQRTYVHFMDRACEVIYEKEPIRLLNVHYESVAIRLMEIKNFELSQKWCERAVYHHPNTLSTYTMQLKLYFTSNQKDKFFSVLEDLRKSNVVIDKETLEMIRVFL
ncbi:MAG: hypothetical protein IKJ39_09860 [Lachnospiraceae bacterium]|nr:hypothetical protein [Lachnospiraceae bacterium]